MPDKIQSISCDHIGVTFDGGVRYTYMPNHGKPCWKATEKIGSIFGTEVDGECCGIGATKQKALERLREDQRRLAESLWAQAHLGPAGV